MIFLPMWVGLGCFYKSDGLDWDFLHQYCQVRLKKTLQLYPYIHVLLINSLKLALFGLGFFVFILPITRFQFYQQQKNYTDSN